MERGLNIRQQRFEQGQQVVVGDVSYSDPQLLPRSARALAHLHPAVGGKGRAADTQPWATAKAQETGSRLTLPQPPGAGVAVENLHFVSIDDAWLGSAFSGELRRLRIVHNAE